MYVCLSSTQLIFFAALHTLHFNVCPRRPISPLLIISDNIIWRVYGSVSILQVYMHACVNVRYRHLQAGITHSNRSTTKILYVDSGAKKCNSSYRNAKNQKQNTKKRHPQQQLARKY